MKTGLSNKTILVTGGLGGIGIAIVNILIEEKANIVLHYHTKRDNYNEIEHKMQDANIDFLMIQADLRNENEVEAMFDEATKKFRRIDGLVNNAGIWPEKSTPILDMKLDQWENTLSTNLKSIFLCSKEFCKNLKMNKGDFGSVVLIGSTAGVFGEAGHIDYSSSKAALHGFMLSLKNEIVQIARYGRVNIVSPGWTLTRMAENELQNNDGVIRALQTIPLRKIASAPDIAKSVVHLLSDELSSHISGQNIVIAGGMEGRLLHEKDEIDVTKVIL
ncbi:MAG: 3-oxoacyl-[acyl-carrier-protein] reductase FabG [Candidatus Heimdallarchaeota archaeon LC_2]|nr:MAG: 3-oxoacyl-[acyl-carrier-protein] reductase FabG [Candidatus Heimdallarchaeota archaeon LC_2]